MSILIKMAMPKNCGECIMSQTHALNNEIVYQCPFTGYFNSRVVTSQRRMNDCPLIELPPHGDLIDRDALMKDGWLCLHKEVMRMGGYAIHELPLINPTIPVVIEREDD